MSKLPAIQFYPGDWRKDMGVQSLTFHDRGVWFEILLLMHESERRGVLVLNGRAMPEDALARLLGLDKQNLTTTITTLLEHGVASRDEHTGALLCRRMVRDESLRAIRQECGKMGGNPQLKRKDGSILDKQNSTSPNKQNPTSPNKQNPTPSSSSSPSSSDIHGLMNDRLQQGPTDTEIDIVRKAYPKKIKPLEARRAIRKAVIHLRSGKDRPAMNTPEALEFLALRAARYAASPSGQQGAFTPHPAKWFNSGSYLEDDAEWMLVQEGSGKQDGRPRFENALETMRAERGSTMGAIR